MSILNPIMAHSKYGLREVCDLRFTKQSGTGPDVFQIETAKMTTLETAATTVYAQGGQGNARRMAWDGEKTVTFTVEDALISPEALQALTYQWCGRKFELADYISDIVGVVLALLFFVLCEKKLKKRLQNEK